MIAPVWKLKKKDITWLAKNRCKHHHTYLEHYHCFEQERDRPEKIGFFDIEASNLKADYGIMLDYCIKKQGGEIISRTITAKELRTCLDKEVVRQLIEDLKGFDRVVTYYGTGFDLPFIRTRAIVHGLDFPEFGELCHTDLYYLVRNKFQLSSNRLENACRVLLGKTNKTRITSEHWLWGLQGVKTSLDYIHEHCTYDVIDLEKLWDKVIGFRKITDLSI